jgi:hypothetical protein
VERNRDRVRAQRKAYYQRTKDRVKHPDVVRAETLRGYGITPKEYNSLLAEQGGVCAICQKPETELGGKHKRLVRQLAVDHDHETGQVRGLLCRRCNTAIGFLGDDVAGLWRAIDYLTRAQPLRSLA